MRGALLQRIREELEALPRSTASTVVDLTTVPEGFRKAVLKDALPLT